MYCFTAYIYRGVENYFPMLWGTGIFDAIFFKPEYPQTNMSKFNTPGVVFTNIPSLSPILYTIINHQYLFFLYFYFFS